jgi:hypothetical protein
MSSGKWLFRLKAGCFSAGCVAACRVPVSRTDKMKKGYGLLSVTLYIFDAFGSNHSCGVNCREVHRCLADSHALQR